MMRISLVRLFFAAIGALFAVDVGRPNAVRAYIEQKSTTTCAILKNCDGKASSANQINFFEDHLVSPLPSLPVEIRDVCLSTCWGGL
jgi:hypothetical protein